MHLKQIPRSIASLAILFSLTAQAEPPAGKATDTRFLLERVKAITDSGIVGIPAGTEVVLLAKTTVGAKVKTKDGTTFELANEKLTSDPAAAEASKKKAEEEEAQNNAKRASLLAAQRAKDLARTQQVESALSSFSQISAASVAVPAASATPFVPSGSILDQPAKPCATVNKRIKEPKDSAQKH